MGTVLLCLTFRFQTISETRQIPHECFKKILGPLIPLFWISGDVCLWVLKPVWIPLLGSSLMYNRFLRFTSCATPADLLVASMVAKLFHPCTCTKALVGLESRIKCAITSRYVTRQTDTTRKLNCLFSRLFEKNPESELWKNSLFVHTRNKIA